jgi:hypothetical protein
VPLFCFLFTFIYLFIFSVLRIESRAVCMLGKGPSTWLYPQPMCYLFLKGKLETTNVLIEW